MLAAAHSDDDLQLVAFNQCLGGKGAARHDIPIAFDGYALPRKAHLFDECCDRGVRRDLARCAIDDEGDHFTQIARVRIRAAFYYMRV